MAKYILRNRTNSPQTVAGQRIAARGTSDPVELDALTLGVVERMGLLSVSPADTAPDADAFDAMSDEELRDVAESLTGKKPHHKTGRAKLLETVRSA